jgi:hypothetical protein
MKKFSNLNNSENNDVQKNVDINKEIKSLVENLSIEIESDNKVWENDFKINTDSKFYENMESALNRLFKEEKIKLLEKAKRSILMRDVSWIDDEIEKVRDSFKEN